VKKKQMFRAKYAKDREERKGKTNKESFLGVLCVSLRAWRETLLPFLVEGNEQ
jgi:hypothetical protein